jgi:hypothetical protein
MRLFYVICAFAVIGASYIGGDVSKTVQVYWIPPEVETYTPVTPDTIEKMAFKIVQLKNERQADKTISLVQKSNQKADLKRIRVKITTADKSYNFDSNGMGISSTGEGVSVDLQRLKQVLCE